MRITLLNASFAIVFAVLWKECLDKLGLYRESFTELLRPVLRLAAGCGIMAGVLALYLEATPRARPSGRAVVTFFVAAFTYEMTRFLSPARSCAGRFGDSDQVVIVGSGRRPQRLGANCEPGTIAPRPSSASSMTAIPL